MATTSHPTILGERFDRAVVYALHIHAAQRRKSSNVPYSAHLLGTCAIALEFGATESEAIAALLHDAVEDCGGREQLAAIHERFGPEVARIVAGCSDSSESEPGARKAPWYERKRRYLDDLAAHAAGDDAILLVSASDKLYNLLAIYNDVLRSGQRTYDRFNAKKFGTLWYYRSLTDVFENAPGRQRDIAQRLSALTSDLAGKSTSSEELLAAFTIDATVDEKEKGALVRRPSVPVA